MLPPRIVGITDFVFIGTCEPLEKRELRVQGLSLFGSGFKVSGSGIGV